MFRLSAAAAVGLALIASPSVAQAPPAPPPAAAAPAAQAGPDLALQAVGMIFDEAMADQMFEEIGSEASSDLNDNFPAEWAPLMTEGFKEELTADHGRIVALLAVEFRRHFTEEELDAAVRLLATSGGHAVYQAAILHRPRPRLTREQKRELAAIERTPAAKAFARKVERSSDSLFAGAEDNFMREVLPGVLRRWGDKIGAFEAARAVAPPAPTRHEQLAARFIASMFEAYGLDNMFDRAAESFSSGNHSAYWAEWSPLFVEAVTEEVTARRQDLYMGLARGIQANFTDDELTAGAAIFTSNVGQRLLRAAAEGRAAPTLSRDEERQLDLLGRMPGARSLMTNMSRLDFKKADMAEMMRLLAPGMLRRMGEKAEAYEARRAAAAP